MIVSHLKHNESIEQEWSFQSDLQHNNGVAEFAEFFANDFGLARCGRILGLLHDKGKEQAGFQNYIKGVSGYDIRLVSSSKTPHAFVGALVAKALYNNLYPLLSYPIMGHHAGLHDYDHFNQQMKNDIPKDVKVEPLDIQPEAPKGVKVEKQDFHHIIRILYSCLVDADYLDTERFMNEDNFKLRKNATTLADILPQLELYLSKLRESATATAVNKIRNDIQNQCVKMSEEKPGFFSLTVPTGGGKTLSSLVWAIRHAIKFNKKRVIIAIPYTSIIVQTAEILRNVFGEENVLEHHSNINPENTTDKKLHLKMKLATENWDYPIVVTTNVQLFESMFSNKPSSCRKLHNISNSVLILDEVQTLPINFLQPIVDGLKTYQSLFGTSVLFTTASQPALKGDIRWGNTKIQKLSGIADIKEIIPEDFNLHLRLKRVHLIIDDERCDYTQIANRLIQHKRVLCIVNTRKDAQELYNLLPKEGLTIHLSRMMCSRHIFKTIKEIKNALKDDANSIIRVVSTQLIEAGVDIDFPVVFRQEAGLDSLLQAAGRCNREGKYGVSNAYVFRLNRPLPSGYISKARDAQLSLPKDSDWFNPKTMIDYFIQLYSRSESFDEAKIETLLNKPMDFSFQTAAQNFRLIQDNSKSVIVNYQDSIELVRRLEKEGPGYNLMKQLGLYTVNVNERDFKELRKSGLIKEIIEGIFLLPDKEQYKDDIGLVTDNHWLEEILIK